MSSAQDINKLIETEIVFGKQQNHLADRVPPRSLGYCYQCNYQGHTIKHCPLSYCSNCKKYGHVFRVCPERKQKEIIAAYNDLKSTPIVLQQLPPIPEPFTSAKR